MIGILVISHGRLAEAIISSVQFLVGHLEKVKGISIWPKDRKEEIRIKRADLPKEVQACVYARMQAERHRIAKRYRAEGEQRSREIRAETDKEKEIILAKAYQQQMKLFGEGDARATEIFASAYEQDPEFYSFLRRLQTYEKLFEGKTTILLESDADILKYFKSPKISK